MPTRQLFTRIAAFDAMVGRQAPEPVETLDDSFAVLGGAMALAYDIIDRLAPMSWLLCLDSSGVSGDP